MSEKICADAGQHNMTCEGEVANMPCPYAEEIDNEIVMVDLCETHAWERGRDV